VPIRICTIGFTRKSAERFFTLLKEARVERLIDTRLNNVSQLAGFAKRDDLAYFTRAICGIDYVHEPLLAPTQELLDAFKKQKGDWTDYERQFNALIAGRRIEQALAPALLHNGCLLCSEDTPEHCHRRLVVDYLSTHWPDVTVEHLV